VVPPYWAAPSSNSLPALPATIIAAPMITEGEPGPIYSASLSIVGSGMISTRGSYPALTPPDSLRQIVTPTRSLHRLWRRLCHRKKGLSNPGQDLGGLRFSPLDIRSYKDKRLAICNC